MLYATARTTTRPASTTSRPEFGTEGSRRTMAEPSMLPLTVRVPWPLKRWLVFEDDGAVGSKARARPPNPGWPATVIGPSCASKLTRGCNEVRCEQGAGWTWLG